MNGTPNILLLCVDGQRWDALGLAGRFPNLTPALDGLGRSGVWFDHAYCTIPMCHPSRSAILTGRYPHKTGVTANLNMPFARQREWPDSERTFSAALKEAGYYTGHIGLPHWGKVPPPSHGFDHHEGPQGAFWQQGPGSYDTHGVPRLGGKTPIYGRWKVPSDTTDTHFIADRAIDFLSRSAARGTPFLLHVDWSGPHLPYIVSDEYLDAVPPCEIDKSPNFDCRDEPERVRMWRRFLGLDQLNLSWDEWSKAFSAYLGYVAEIDAAVGRVLEHLDRLGLDQNTVVIFTSDHGEMIGSRGLLEKGPAGYEELFRVPLIVRWPHVALKHHVCSELVQTTDIFPTILEAAGLEKPGNVDGVSLLDTLQGNHRRSSIYGQYHSSPWGDLPLRMIRTREWKLVYSVSDRGECYNLVDDPYETRNLIDDPKAKANVAALQAELLETMERVGDPLLHGARKILR